MPSLLADNLDFIDRDKYLNKGIANVTGQDVGNFGKGSLTGLLTVAPDLLGMLFNAGNVIRAKSDPESVTRGTPFPSNFNGDPIRQAFGTDNTAGLLGEFADPSATAVKGVGLLGDFVRYAPEAAAGFKGLLGMTLFHGTPHKFDKFSLDAIGTGEGAQAFGHGLYFAEDKAVAGSYVKNIPPERFRGMDLGTDLMFLQNKMDAMPVNSPQFRALQERYAVLEDIGIGKNQKQLIDKFDDADEYLAETRELVRSIKSDEVSTGSLYEVEIPDDITAKMLDWDAPLSEQPESVRKIAADAFARETGMTPNHPNYAGMVDTIGRQLDAKTGKDLYRALSQTELNKVRELPGSRFQNIANNLDVKGDEAASKLLNEAGIPGIRFYDGNSRSAQEGTRNIVVFNPDDITQVKRNDEIVFQNKLGIGQAK